MIITEAKVENFLLEVSWWQHDFLFVIIPIQMNAPFN